MTTTPHTPTEIPAIVAVESLSASAGATVDELCTRVAKKKI